MKTTRFLLLAAFCFLVLSCTKHDQMKAGPPAPPSPPPVSPSPVHENVAGGLASREPGETLSTDFKGTSGVTEKKRGNIQPVLLRAVRTGKHETFDRVVFEFEGNAVPGFHIEYVDKPVRDCGQGEPIAVSGDALLLIRLQPSNAHTDAGISSVSDRQQTPGLPILKQLRLICDFEADVQWVLGLSSQNHYRVLELSNPARLVVDIAHRPSGA